MRLRHYLHVYALPPLWPGIVAEHLDALYLSGLDREIDHLRLGIVGDPVERNRVREFCSERIGTVVVAEADTGFEQVTLQALAAASDYDAVLYSHSKGVTHGNDNQWRRSMTEAVVTNWRQCVKLLVNHEAVGPYWMTQDSDNGRFIPVFGGNAWWATRDLIGRLPPIKTESRYDAEGWIGLGFENRDNAPGIYNLITDGPPTDPPKEVNVDFVDEYLDETQAIISALDPEQIEAVAQGLAAVTGRVFVLGNGGSAATASHLVNDLRKLCHIEAYAPTDNVAELTAWTNDAAWEASFVGYLNNSRLTDADALFILSVGGGSEQTSTNIRFALSDAKTKNVPVFGIVGRDGGMTLPSAKACVIIPPMFKDRVTPHTEGLASVVCHLIVSHPALKP